MRIYPLDRLRSYFSQSVCLSVAHSRQSCFPHDLSDWFVLFRPFLLLDLGLAVGGARAGLLLRPWSRWPGSPLSSCPRRSRRWDLQRHEIRMEVAHTSHSAADGVGMIHHLLNKIDLRKKLPR